MPVFAAVFAAQTSINVGKTMKYFSEEPTGLPLLPLPLLMSATVGQLRGHRGPRGQSRAPRLRDAAATEILTPPLREARPLAARMIGHDEAGHRCPSRRRTGRMRIAAGEQRGHMTADPAAGLGSESPGSAGSAYAAAAKIVPIPPTAVSSNAATAAYVISANVSRVGCR